MAKYETELTYVERDGKRYPAKVLNYMPDGTLAKNYGDEKYEIVDAKKINLAGIKTRVVTLDNREGTEVEIKEFRCVKTLKAGKLPSDPDAYVFTPVLAVMVNVGSDKRGEVWNSVNTATFKDFLTIGAHVHPKPYLERMAAPTQPKGK